MELKDLLELARLGYKPNDVKELLALQTEEPKTTNNSNDLKSDDDPKEDPKEDPIDEDPIDAIIKREKGEK